MNIDISPELSALIITLLHKEEFRKSKAVDRREALLAQAKEEHKGAYEAIKDYQRAIDEAHRI